MRRGFEVGAAVALAGSSLLMASCGGHADSIKQPLTTTTEKTFAGDPVDKAIADYRSILGCTAEVTVSYVDGLPNTDPYGGDVAATSVPGHIDIDSQDFGKMNPEQKRDIALHEMSHACADSEPTILDQPFFLADSTKVFAVQGLRPQLEFTSGEKSQFTLIEEGAAEALAYSVDHSYGTNSVYYAYGKLTLDLMGQHGITPLELEHMLQTNDLGGYAARVFGSDAPADVDDEIITLGNLYQQASNAAIGALDG